MPTIKRNPKLETEEYPYAANYKCKCEKPMSYYADVSPERFRDLLCFDCIVVTEF